MDSLLVPTLSLSLFALVAPCRQIKVWIRELHTIVGPDIIIAIAGNKVDEEKRRAVNRETAEEYARSVGAIHILTSAKMNKGIDTIFSELVSRTCPTPPRA